MRFGFTSVVGDLMHAGHALMLDECKRHCDYLYVGIITDPTKDRAWKTNLYSPFSGDIPNVVVTERLTRLFRLKARRI